MKRTITLKVNREDPEVDKIRAAAKIIRKGGLVAFPTETVYGLGADALNPDAVTRIYTAKRRPLDNPIIVHVSSKSDITRLTGKVPDEAEKLVDAFWPGPLTLVLKASMVVPEATRGGLDTVAVRMPDHKVALALIREAGVPIAAPSANLSGKPSPTTAEHVSQDLNGRIEMILDCGPTRIGVESTVLDLTTVPPQILRPGGAPLEDLEKILGQVILHPAAEALGKTLSPEPRSPGMRHRHYAPRARLIVVEGKPEACARKVQEIVDAQRSSGRKVGVLATDDNSAGYVADAVKSLGARTDSESAARNLFRMLREFDEEQVDVIVAEGVPLEGLGLAVMNRLRKASGFNVVKVG